VQREVTASHTMTRMTSTLGRLNDTVAKLEERLERPISAVTTIAGRDGVADNMDRYNRLLKNKSYNKR
ncbi:MAG: hypothetical protein K2H86_03610, partial [Muribaculaceae bacterium]|nr:hypothetical protein [Muribaculaceae bacterium]